MTTTRSASGLSLGIGAADQTASHTEIGGPDHGLTGFPIGQASATTEYTSGGLTSQRDTGFQVNTASFTVNEDDVTAPLFAGQNGRRCNIEYQYGTAGEKNCEAILTISHVWEARGIGKFNVEVAIDGDVDD